MANRGFCSEEVKPLHVFAQPDRQRSSGPERGVVGSPGGGLVAGLWPFGPLMRRGHQRNQVSLCNKAIHHLSQKIEIAPNTNNINNINR